MKSEQPKVAHQILGVRRWCAYVVDAARTAGCERVVVVTGHGAEHVEAALGDVEPRAPGAAARHRARGHVRPRGARGTSTGRSSCSPATRRSCGPRPSPGSIAMRESAAASATRAHRANLPDPGRLRPHRARPRRQRSQRIVEQKDCTAGPAPPSTRSTPARTASTPRVLFAHLDRLGTDNAQGEYYLTDMVEVFNAGGAARQCAAPTDDPLEALGRELAGPARRGEQGACSAASTSAHMLDGVTMTDPDLVWVGPDVTLGRDVELDADDVPDRPDDGRRRRASSGPNTRVTDSAVGRGRDGSTPSSCSSAQVGAGATVGPVAYLRPGTVLEASAKAGRASRSRTRSSARAARSRTSPTSGTRRIGAGRERRRRLHHLQLRRRATSTRPSSATARSSALIRCSWRPSASARVPSPAREARSHGRPGWRARRSSAPSMRTSRAGPRAAQRKNGSRGTTARTRQRRGERMSVEQRMMVFSGPSNPEFAEGIARHLGVELGNVKIRKFANGEIYVRYLESVRGADVFLIQSMCEPVNDTLMELLIMIDAAKRAPREHHRGHQPLRLRAAGQEVAPPASRSRPSSSPTSSRPPASTASSRWTCTRARSKASSTSR